MKHSLRCRLRILPSLAHLEVYNDEAYSLHEALDNLGLRIDMCCLVGYPNKVIVLQAFWEEMFVALRTIFQERELTSKRVSGSHTYLDKIQESNQRIT